MAKLNQILAIHKGVKSEAYAKITELHKIIQKPELFVGFRETYQSNDDAGDKLEPRSQKVQFIATELLDQVRKEEIKLINIEARRDWTNTKAHADIVVDGQVLIEKVPATHLLFLEKQLSDLRDVVAKLPILDTGDEWKFDEPTGLQRTDPVKTHRTKKTETALVLLQPTEKHPGQAKSIVSDVIESYWTKINFSGAIARPAKMEMLERVETLRDAVKTARENANMQDELVPPDVGKAVFSYLMPEGA